MRLGLRARVALTFGVLSLAVALAVSGTTYFLARVYLLNQRETAALTRALLDARAASAGLEAGTAPGRVLEQIPSVGTSQPLLFVDDEWYTAGVTVSPESLPADLLFVTADTGGAWQRFTAGSDPYLAVAVGLPAGLYVEVFPLRDLDTTFVIAGWVLFGLAVTSFGIGVTVGRGAGARILRPLRDLSDGAGQIAEGDYSVRLRATGDPDLDPISDSFNEMAQAVQAQISRERRFTANVSHELRSPLTSVLGTAELLERRRESLPERDAGIVEVLVRQVRRMSSMVLDLLEISSVTSDTDLQRETADVTALVREVLRDRDLPEDLVHGAETLAHTDARRFERIVGNLVDNAQRHGGGVTRIEVISPKTSRDPVVITVDDEGPGIEPEEAVRLFEPFTRGSGAAGTDGAGLGLALVREQSRRLGASVDITANPVGRGARFIVILPVEAP
jgi:two-component system, OmpR family, sensor histidine kinase MtrB